MIYGTLSDRFPFQVSFGSELSNRAPTFDMDLSDFMEGDQPISYEKAFDYFARDPSQKYVQIDYRIYEL